MTFADHMEAAEERALKAIRDEFNHLYLTRDERGHAMLAAVEQHYLDCISDAFRLVTKAMAPDSVPRLKIVKKEAS